MRVRDVGYTKKSPFRYKIRLFKPIYNERKGDFMANKANSLSHTKWVCKYHIVFTPKYRRKIIYNQYKESIRDIIKQLCAYKGVEILEGHLMIDHMNMRVSKPTKLSVSKQKMIHKYEPTRRTTKADEDVCKKKKIKRKQTKGCHKYNHSKQQQQ